MAETPDISIITVNFNGIADTRELLKSIDNCILDLSYEVIVVDNGSENDEANALSTEYMHHKILRSDKNLGFSGGNNLGINASSGKFIFLLNNDALLVDNSIIELVKVLESDSSAGAVSPKIYYQDSAKIIQFAGFTEFSKLTVRNSIIGSNELDYGQYDTLAETASAHGAAMMVKREVVEKAGLMPEIYFLYYEEHDWCANMKRLGYKIFFQPSATIVHKESRSTGIRSYIKSYYISRNRILFAFRNSKGLIKYVSLVYLILIANTKDFLKFFFTGRRDLSVAVFKGVRDFFKLKNKFEKHFQNERCLKYH